MALQYCWDICFYFVVMEGGFMFIAEVTNNEGHHIGNHCSWCVYHQSTIHGIHKNHCLSCMTCPTCMHEINIFKGLQSCHQSGVLCLVSYCLFLPCMYGNLHQYHSKIMMLTNRKIMKNDAIKNNTRIKKQKKGF